MEDLEYHFTEPEVTVRLTRTEVGILRSALFHSDETLVADGATVTVPQVKQLFQEVLNLQLRL